MLRFVCDAFALGPEGIQMGTRSIASDESSVHDHFKQTVLAAEATSTWVPDKASRPCNRALKAQRTQTILEAGLMPANTVAGIQPIYFDGDMDAAWAEFHAVTARRGVEGGRRFG